MNAAAVAFASGVAGGFVGAFVFGVLIFPRLLARRISKAILAPSGMKAQPACPNSTTHGDHVDHCGGPAGHPGAHRGLCAVGPEPTIEWSA